MKEQQSNKDDELHPNMINSLIVGRGSSVGGGWDGFVRLLVMDKSLT